MKKKIWPSIFFSIFIFQSTWPITIAYYMRLRRPFLMMYSATGEQNPTPWSVTAYPYYENTHRTIIDDCGTHVNEITNEGGTLLDLQYTSDSFLFQAITGIERAASRTCGTVNFTNSRTGADDIVIFLGYNFHITDNLQFILYSMNGIPTYRKITCKDIFETLIGTRFFNLGFGTETSYNCFNKEPHALIVSLQTRFLHQFSRKWYPILPCNAEIVPGNLTTLLFTLQYDYKKHLMEFNYYPEIYTNQGTRIDNIRHDIPNYVRHVAYVRYAYAFTPTGRFNNPMSFNMLAFIVRKHFHTKINGCMFALTLAF